MAPSRTEADSPAYAEEAPLTALFGTPARTKLISVLVSERGRDLSKSEIARQAGLSRTTVYEHLERFVELGIVEETRTTRGGQSQRYQFDATDSIGAALLELEGLILHRLLRLDEGLE